MLQFSRVIYVIYIVILLQLYSTMLFLQFVGSSSQIVYTVLAVSCSFVK